MSNLAPWIRIRGVYTRSINLPRDVENLELIQSYLPTSRALQALTQVIEGLESQTAGRAQALIGPYGSGKSAYGLFLSALLAPGPANRHQTALSLLRTHAPALAARFHKALKGSRGFLTVQINGLPDSLVRQLMLALGASARKAALDAKLVENIHAAAKPGHPMAAVLNLKNFTQIFSRL